MSGADNPRAAAGRRQQRAQALIDLRRYTEALELLAQAIAADPDDFELHCMRSRALLELGSYPEALAASETAARLAPDEAWPFTLRSAILVKLDRVREALKAAREAARLAPYSSQAQFQLAIGEWMCWHRRAGRAAAERVRELAPEESTSYELLAWFDLGLWRFRSAEENAREALRLNPQSSQALNYLGQALRGQRKGREAIETFVRAARLSPGDPTLRYQLKLTIEGYLVRGLWPVLPGIYVYLRIMDGPNFPRPYREWVAVGAFLGVVGVAALVFFVHQRRLHMLPPEVVSFYKDAQWRVDGS